MAERNAGRVHRRPKTKVVPRQEGGMGTKLIPTFESFLELTKVSLSCGFLLVSFFFRKARVKKIPGLRAFSAAPILLVCLGA